MSIEPDIRPFQAIGDVASKIFGRTPPPPLEPGTVAYDCPVSLPWERRMLEAAHDARARGAEIVLTRYGMLVRKGGKSELVRLEQIECGILMRALDRVAPYEHELY